MTVFAKKMLDLAGWSKIQDQIAGLQMSMGAPYDLMMFSAKTNDRLMDAIYIGLPEKRFLDMFPGFEEISRESLPDYLITLVCREDGFKERFPDIAAKRRPRIG